MILSRLRIHSRLDAIALIWRTINSDQFSEGNSILTSFPKPKV